MLGQLGDDGVSVRKRIIGIGIFLVAANLGAWAWAFLAFRDYPVLLGTALLAYSLGARHAIDADHIAAIDNVTRKLMRQGHRPVAVGLYFSLGHSTVVVLASAAMAGAAVALQARFAMLREAGGLVGTSISALFLFAIALANLVVLRAVYRTFQRVKRGGSYAEEEIDGVLAQRGLIGRLLRPVFRLIGTSWHMYPLGFLFGLGFDTATEIGLLGISAAEASNGLPIWSILVFAALFTAGMSLIDSADGILLLGAYGWAYANPLRKLYYNLTITCVSVLAAFAIGGIEVLGLLADRLRLEGPFWRAVAALNDNFGSLGCLVIGIFLASWIAALAIYRIRGYRRLEAAKG